MKAREPVLKVALSTCTLAAAVFSLTVHIKALPMIVSAALNTQRGM